MIGGDVGTYIYIYIFIYMCIYMYGIYVHNRAILQTKCSHLLPSHETNGDRTMSVAQVVGHAPERAGPVPAPRRGAAQGR